MKQPSKSQVKKRPVFHNLVKIKNDGIHFDCTKYYSYDAFIGIIDGGRGVGKTTTFCKQGILNCDKGEQFIYLRRYKPEIREFVKKDSLAPIIDNVMYKGDGSGGYIMNFEDVTLGYCIPLSTARAHKSVDFSKVTLIIYDEGIVRQTAAYRYLHDEVIELLEFISTVVRTRKNVKVVILGNNEDLFSPYHSFWDIPAFEKVYYDRKRKIYCEHVPTSPQLLELEKETGLYAAISGTSYGQYHYHNKNINEESVPISPTRPNYCKQHPMFRVNVDKQTVNVYTYYEGSELRLYCEYRDKKFDDNITYNLMEKGKINYLAGDLFKKRVRPFLYRFYFNNKILYNSGKAGALIGWVIENT